jgi:cytochrome c
MCLFLAVNFAIAACEPSTNTSPGQNNAKPLTAVEFVGEEVLANDQYLATAPYSNSDWKLGERIVMQCRACHTLQDGGANMVGPNLFGVFGREAASTAGFDYSPALRNANIVWSPAALDAWLVNPAKFLPGNRMPFAGIRDKDDRNALIAFLLSETDGSSADDTTAQ